MPPPGRRRTRRPGPRGDAGTVTAETALALPALVAVLALALWTVGAVTVQLRCSDAAAGAARAAARGDRPDAVAALARRLAPAGARVDVRVQGEEVHVVVAAAVEPPALAAAVPALQVSGRAVALVEPGAGP